MDTISPWVAVVDDEEAIRRALLRLLRSAGIKAQAFASGRLLLDSLQTSEPYCVILDLHMPEMSGFEVQAELAQRAPQVRVIVVTGHHTFETQARASLGNPIAYLLKPMNDQLLLDAINAAGATHSSHTAHIGHPI